jgi:hypothetical protein
MNKISTPIVSKVKFTGDILQFCSSVTKCSFYYSKLTIWWFSFLLSVTWYRTSAFAKKAVVVVLCIYMVIALHTRLSPSLHVTENGDCLWSRSCFKTFAMPSHFQLLPLTEQKCYRDYLFDQLPGFLQSSLTHDTSQAVAYHLVAPLPSIVYGVTVKSVEA